MPQPYKKLKTFQLRSKMPMGIHKGFTIEYLVNHNYLLYMRKRGWIKLSTSATTRLLWAIQDRKDNVKPPIHTDCLPFDKLLQNRPD